MSILTPDEVSRAYSERIFDIAGTSRSKRKIVCPLPGHHHQSYTPSFSIYWSGDRWRWRCHGNCNKQGDVIDLIGYTNLPNYDPNDSKQLSRAISMLTGENFNPVPPLPPKKTVSQLSPTQWRDYPLKWQVIQYAGDRGICKDMLEKYRIGGWADGDGKIWMTLPTFHGYELRGIKMRNLGEGLRYRAVKGSRAGLFNMNNVHYNTGRVYVVKGEIAALVLIQRGLLACAPTGGEAMVLGEEYQKALAFADVVVIGDNDRDPDVRTETTRLAVERATSLHAQLTFPPDEYKDVDEWVLNDPEAIEKLKGI